MQASGGCLCQAIRYKFDAEPVAIINCHCRDCQHATGSGFATVFGVEEAAVTIQEEQTLGAYTVQGVSGKNVTRLFCQQCGSPLFTRAEGNPGFIWIKAGSLDDSSWVQPQATCFAADSEAWSPPLQHIPQFAGNPE